MGLEKVIEAQASQASEKVQGIVDNVIDLTSQKTQMGMIRESYDNGDSLKKRSQKLNEQLDESVRKLVSEGETEDLTVKLLDAYAQAALSVVDSEEANKWKKVYSVAKEEGLYTSEKGKQLQSQYLRQIFVDVLGINVQENQGINSYIQEIEKTVKKGEMNEKAYQTIESASQELVNGQIQAKLSQATKGLSTGMEREEAKALMSNKLSGLEYDNKIAIPDEPDKYSRLSLVNIASAYNAVNSGKSFKPLEDSDLGYKIQDKAA